MKRIIGFSVLVLGIVLFSCQNKNVDVPVNNDELIEKAAQITLGEVVMESTTNEVEYEVNFYANAQETITRWWKIGKRWSWTNKLRYKIKNCPDVVVEEGDNDGFPKTITLNYGDGTELKNGKVLSGIIVIEISAPKDAEEKTRTVTYDNFGVDSVSLVGTAVMEHDKSDETFRTFKSDLTFTLADGTVIDRTSDRQWQWLEGADTDEDQTDDVIQITGIVNATKGTDTYSKEITDPLIRQRDCKYITAGEVVITVNDVVMWTMNYGQGDCNSIAIVTDADGNVKEVDLANRKMKDRKDGNKDEGKGDGNRKGDGNGKG